MTDQTWNSLLREQIAWHWTEQVRPRLTGLTDDEYFWEPTPDCWNVRRRGTGTAPIQAGAGAMTIDFAWPPPDPPPFTTIAWRLGHVIVGVLAMRNAWHFGGPPTDYESFEYPETAAAALDRLDTEYARWDAGVAALGADGLSRAAGAAEGPYAEYPMSALVLHINRELIHHLSEVCLLRDLYLHTDRNRQETD
ncbi:DinB family protein [Nocardia spumae]|uniref:DinB family protein n=1 Tax=Nocardia spumae TaxID=2887190 RepID=UPI001D15C9CF|nr:DinB family protein [Nocardia spumae]